MSPRFSCSLISSILLIVIVLTARCVEQPTAGSLVEPPSTPRVNQVTIYQDSAGSTEITVPVETPSPKPTMTLNTPAPAAIPPEPLPKALINGGSIQDGPFTFFLWIYHDPTMNQNPVTPSLYSDLNGYGAYLFWVYQGDELFGPIYEWWGAGPNLQELNMYASLKTNDKGGRSGGILLPGGFFISGESHPGDTVKLVIKLASSSAVYGASISFTLKSGPNGWEPVDISTPRLLD